MIKCHECGRMFKSMATHLTRAHGLTAREYRARWDIPAGEPLASESTRLAISEQMRMRVALGAHDYSHLPQAVEAARHAGKWPRATETREKQRAVAKAIKRKMIEPGGKRADGRNADRAREYQREYRKRKLPK